MSKKMYLISMALLALAISAAANADECGTLQVSSFDGQIDLVLAQQDGALELTASDAMSKKMSAYDGKQVCVDLSSSRDAYGDAENKVISFRAER